LVRKRPSQCSGEPEPSKPSWFRVQDLGFRIQSLVSISVKLLSSFRLCQGADAVGHRLPGLPLQVAVILGMVRCDVDLIHCDF